MIVEMSVINQYVADFILPFSRISALVMSMAGLGSRTIPTRIKLLFCVLVTVAIMPAIPKSQVTELLSAGTIFLVGEQIMIGVALGFLTMMLLNTFTLAGQVIAMQTGLGFASLVDPASGTNVPAVGQFFLILSSLIFWALDGHLTFLTYVVMSFDTLPIPLDTWESVKFKEIAEWGAWMFATALSLSLAPITAMLLINFAFGVMTRAAPQLNIFAIGFPISMTAGLIIMWLTIGQFMVHFEIQWKLVNDFACYLIGCGGR